MTQKRVRLSAEVRQEQILETATQLFIEQGFTHVQMGDIAEKLGVSRPNIYTYFASTEAVFGALLERYTAALLADLRRGLDADPWMPVAETLDIVLRHPELVMLLKSAGAPMLQGYRRTVLDTLTAQMYDVWKDYQSPQRCKTFDQLMVIQHNLFMETAYEVLTHPGDYDLDLIKQQLHEMLMAAYRIACPQIPAAWEKQVLDGFEK